jgi:UDP-N-acetylglucosamine--N-acetylmuramyl-(pentapeptide) pyrophosphoryl-undecaprenol N-acetylglucosamine transferase
VKGTVLIVGGGTGGHITPGIALYEEINNMGARVLFLTSYRDKRFPLLGDVDEEDLFYYRGPSLAKNPLKFIPFLVNFFLSFLKSYRIIKKMNVRAVVGMGGYVSAPALLAGMVLKRKIFLAEQNSVPGKVTLLLEKKSAGIFTTFQETKGYLQNTNVVHCTGNPVRKRSVRPIGKSEAKKRFHVNHAKHVVLVIGGSQGALGINKSVLAVKKEHPELFKDVALVWITGSYSYDMMRDQAGQEADTGSLFLVPFIEDIAFAYRAADLAISRSGAGVMAELALAGVPSILIPFPYATQDHQSLNAQDFERQGASVIIKEDNAVGGNLAQSLMTLLSNKSLLKRMAKKAGEAAKPDAGRDMAQIIIESIDKVDTGVSK